MPQGKSDFYLTACALIFFQNATTYKDMQMVQNTKIPMTCRISLFQVIYIATVSFSTVPPMQLIKKCLLQS